MVKRCCRLACCCPRWPVVVSSERRTRASTVASAAAFPRPARARPHPWSPARTQGCSVVRSAKAGVAAKAAARLALYRETLVADFDATIGPGAGAAWWAKHVAPAAAVLGHPSPA